MSGVVRSSEQGENRKVLWRAEVGAPYEGWGHFPFSVSAEENESAKILRSG